MTDDLKPLLRDSHAFHYGQHYERRRVGELLRQRMTVCRDAGEPQAVIDEIKHLCALIDEAE